MRRAGALPQRRQIQPNGTGAPDVRQSGGASNGRLRHTQDPLFGGGDPDEPIRSPATRKLPKKDCGAFRVVFRDFKGDHPDMEVEAFLKPKETVGLVAQRLPADGIPTYAHPPEPRPHQARTPSASGTETSKG